MNAETNTLSPYVNTDVKIPRKLRLPLALHETSCCMRGVKSVTENAVRQYFIENYGEDIASMFKPSFLLTNQAV